MKTSLIYVFVFFFCTSSLNAQEKPYREIANERATKIVENLNIADAAKEKRVTEMIAGQYIGLNKIHSERDQAIEKNREKAEEIKLSADKKVSQLHENFLKQLNAALSAAQIDEVKNGLTYHTVPITYKNYLLMLPYSTKAQQEQIYTFLIEGREKAMDGGSSKEKHAWFNKYKGKIANYLTAEGYDLKEEGRRWAKRRDLKSTDFEITMSNVIVDTLRLSDKDTRESVRNFIADQYQRLGRIQGERDAALVAIKSMETEKEANEKKQAEVWTNYKKEVDEQRNAYLMRLSEFLDIKQIELVKDEMTAYGLQKEYTKFQALLPEMTAQQKEKVYEYLVEARENALNVLSSRDRNQWFAKYRGRANNYLSAQGYDLRKATEALERKQAAEKAAR